MLDVSCRHHTINSTQRLEVLARQEGFIIKGYHSDNGAFASKAFDEDLHARVRQAPSAEFVHIIKMGLLIATFKLWQIGHAPACFMLHSIDLLMPVFFFGQWLSTMTPGYSIGCLRWILAYVQTRSGCGLIFLMRISAGSCVWLPRLCFRAKATGW